MPASMRMRRLASSQKNDRGAGCRRTASGQSSSGSSPKGLLAGKTLARPAGWKDAPRATRSGPVGSERRTGALHALVRTCVARRQQKISRTLPYWLLAPPRAGSPRIAPCEAGTGTARRSATLRRASLWAEQNGQAFGSRPIPATYNPDSCRKSPTLSRPRRRKRCRAAQRTGGSISACSIRRGRKTSWRSHLAAHSGLG